MTDMVSKLLNFRSQNISKLYPTNGAHNKIHIYAVEANELQSFNAKGAKLMPTLCQTSGL